MYPALACLKHLTGEGSIPAEVALTVDVSNHRTIVVFGVRIADGIEHCLANIAS